MTWVTDIPDPDSFLSPMCSSGGAANFEGYTSPEVDALLLQGRSTRSSLERLQVYQRAERLVLSDAPIVRLFRPLAALVVLGNVRGLHLTPMGVGNLAMENVGFAPGADAPQNMLTSAAVPGAAAPAQSDERLRSHPSNTAGDPPTLIPGRTP